MTYTTLFNVVLNCVLGGVFGLKLCYAEADMPYVAPPGTYHTSWIGNTFGGNGAGSANANGYGYWVQDGVGAMDVSPDGTVFLGVKWDEGGRDVGLYKEGQTNRVVVKALASPIKAWGFNTANNALCVAGSFFYVGTVSKALLRFQWTPGDINSALYLDEVTLPEIPSDLSCSGGKIIVTYADKIEVRDETSLQPTESFPVQDASSALLAPDGSFWTIEGDKVRHLDAHGNDTGRILSGVGDPTSLAWGKQGTLIVTDNGPAQQVLFFDISGTPRLASTFGVKGGVYSGTPGAVAPQKLFALRGAGVDAQGNLYVAMSFTPGPGGNTFLRAFSPSGNLLWEDDATAFVDTFGFDPGSDGTVVYGRTTRWQLNLDNQKPGTEGTLEAVTVDPIRYPADTRVAGGYAVYPRLIKGTRLVYMISQFGGGYAIYVQPYGTDILHQVGSTPKGGWAWYVTDDGNIWNGDAPGNKIALYTLESITADGQPVYDWNNPRTWPWPTDFSTVSRTIYNKDTDSLYVFGYLKGQPTDNAWGTVGLSARRYDGWLAGNPHVRWTNSALPAGPNGLGPGKPLPAKEASLAGNYLFLGMVRNEGNEVRINILDADTGQFVGTLMAGPEVGGVGGWEDAIGSVQATRRRDGEYLILVEEDWRAKNLLFRWKP